VLQWNLNIQQQVSKTTTMTVGYIGSRGIHQPFRTEDANMVLPTFTTQGYLWPSPSGSGTKVNPNVGTIRALWWLSDSYYDALDAHVTSTVTRQFQLNSSFTWGKSIDTNSATIAGDAFGNSVPSLDWFNVKLGRGVSDFNIGKLFTTSIIWQAPSLASTNAIAWAAKGWELGGVYKVESGVPFTPLVGGDPLGKNSSDPWDYPNRVAGCSLVNHNYKTNGALNYVNTSCFTFPNPSTLRGNAGRNIIVGPMLSGLDVSLYKNNPIRKLSEDFNAQFRIETFNILKSLKLRDTQQRQPAAI
jgi:hypothetical protein